MTHGLIANSEFFAAGMVLAQWHVDPARNRPGLDHPRLVACMGAIVIGAAIWSKETGLAGAPVFFADLIALGLSLVIAGLLTLKSGVLFATFANRPAQLLGMMCFSLYIWHEPLLRHVFQADIVPLDGLIRSLPVYFILLGAIGVVSYRFIEFGRVKDWHALLPVPAGGSVQVYRNPSAPKVSVRPARFSGGGANR
jgi:peptidoglycan/LPS O-acetylase OafA/YrhL